MARATVGATVGIGGGTSQTPYPAGTASQQSSGDAVQRAKWIAGGLFVLLVVLHTRARTGGAV